MSDRFDDDPREAAAVPERPQNRSRALLITGLVLVLAFFALTTFSSIYTDRLWYSAEGYGSVFSRLFWTRTGLFLVFGLLMAVAVGANMYLAHRFRPFFRPDSPEQAGLERYRDAVLPVRGWLVAGVSVVIGLFAGTAAAGSGVRISCGPTGCRSTNADTFFRQGHRLLRLRAALAALPRQLHDGHARALRSWRRPRCTTSTAGSGCRCRATG